MNCLRENIQDTGSRKSRYDRFCRKRENVYDVMRRVLTGVSNFSQRR